MHAHAGDLEGARKLARQNVDRVQSKQRPNRYQCEVAAARSLASYGHLLADDAAYTQMARDFGARVRDIGQQLELNGFRNGSYSGSERTTYDASCHLYTDNTGPRHQ